MILIIRSNFEFIFHVLRLELGKASSRTLITFHVIHVVSFLQLWNNVTTGCGYRLEATKSIVDEHCNILLDEIVIPPGGAVIDYRIGFIFVII